MTGDYAGIICNGEKYYQLLGGFVDQLLNK